MDQNVSVEALNSKVWTSASLSELMYNWVQKMFGYLLDEMQQENPEGEGKGRVMVIGVSMGKSSIPRYGASLNKLSYYWYKSCLATSWMKYNKKTPKVRVKEG